MKQPKDFQFAIFGRIVYTDHLIKELHARGFPPPVAIVSPDEEYMRDKKLLTPYGLCGDMESLASRGLVRIYKMENVNCDEAIEILSGHKCNIGFSTSCRNIIKKMIIDYFKGQIFNIHDSYLPDERGGALNTWRILNGINTVGDTVHYLDEGIDSGDVILQGRVAIKKDHPKPVDYLIAEVDNCKKLLSGFLDILLKEDPVPARPQDHNKSFYYPRLYTEQNGIINWDWDINSVERFIRAFSVPYPGAYTYYNGQKVHILDSYIDTSVSQEFHPFCNGKIVTILDDRYVRVIAGGRALILKEIRVGEKVMDSALYLSVKYTLTSSGKDIEQAKRYVPTTREMNVPEMSRSR
ncbi:MAG: hypothetical protein JW919_00780 [Candidatus Omnitrophica bacterium]|nr:hypothetical protein [Candidatus Omnitrophota bacterium]